MYLTFGACIIHDYAPVSSVTEWFAGEWFATGCSQILIFSFPRFPRDERARPFSLPPFPSFLFLFSSLSQPKLHARARTGRTFNTVGGESRVGMKLLLRNICITKWCISCIGRWPLAGERGEKWSSAVDGRVLLASECNTATS